MTHGLAGLLMADLTLRAYEARAGMPAPTGLRRTAVALGIIAAEFPDADLLYSGGVLGMGKLGYLLHHRGHTHTVVFAIIIALALWAFVLLIRRDARKPAERGLLLALALAGTLSHILLDFTNSYGVHPFWPLNNRWFYGDAIFIIEPWLWIAAIPPLLFNKRSAFGRVVLSLALVAILAAAWYVDQVGTDVALVLTVSAALWTAIMWRLHTAQRLSLAVGAWLLVESVGFAASSTTRAHIVQASANTQLLDAVINSAAGNALCQNVLVIELNGDSYDLTSGVVAPWPALRSAMSCAGGESGMAKSREAQQGLGDGLQPSSRVSNDTIVWLRVWRGARTELVHLATTHCEVAAALEFMRAPVWDVEVDGTVRLSDLRYGFDGNGFADVTFAASPDTCPGYVPGWIPPRADVIGADQLQPKQQQDHVGWLR